MSDKSLVVLISGGGSNLQALIDGCQNGAIDGQIKLVLSNKADAYGLERAQAAGIPTAVISHKDYPTREAFDQAVAQRIDEESPKLVVLAGFMRILTEGFVNHYQGRMLNIHPSLLPKYQGLNTHQRAIDAKDDIAGVTVHFVTPELDGGPNILQAIVPILPDDNAAELAKRVLTQEHVIYPQAVQWFLQGRLQLDQHGVLFDDEYLPQSGLQLDSRG